MRFRRTTWVLVSAALAAGLGSVAYGWVVAGSSSAASGDPYHLATSGTPIAASSLGPITQSALKSEGLADATFSILGTADGRAFYQATASDGTVCFADGPAGTSEFGLIDCAQPGSTPLVNPVIDLSETAVDPTDETRSVHLLRFEGVAASVVAKVGFTTTDGKTVTTPVTGDFYKLPATDAPASPVCGFFATDAAGHTIWSSNIC
jgi:hypothetical protein